MLPSKRQLSDLIGSLYEAAGDMALWESFLGELSRTVQADAAASVIHLWSLGDVHTARVFWNMHPEAERQYQQHYFSRDVWAIRGRWKSSGSVFTSESLCPLTELATTEIYNDFLVQYGVKHGMFGVVENNAPRWVSVSLFRGGPRSSEFRVSDLETLNLLIPHMQRAFISHFRLSKLKEQNRGIEASLNMLRAGVIFVGGTGEIVLMNTKAEELLRRRDGLLLVRGRLSAGVHAEANGLRTAISEATQTNSGKGSSAGGTIPVSRERRIPLTITVAPLRNITIGFGQQPSVVLFISDPDENVELPADLLRRCYGLTTAETRLTMLLLEGRSLREAADGCGVTRQTPRSRG